MPKAPQGLALPRLDKEERSLDLRLRLKGRAAQDLIDYGKAYEADHGEAIDPELLAQHIIAIFLERDRGFQLRRKAADNS